MNTSPLQFTTSSSSSSFSNSNSSSTATTATSGTRAASTATTSTAASVIPLTIDSATLAEKTNTVQAIVKRLPSEVAALVQSFASLNDIPDGVFSIILSYLSEEDISQFLAAPDFLMRVEKDGAVQERLCIYCGQNEKTASENDKSANEKEKTESEETQQQKGSQPEPNPYDIKTLNDLQKHHLNSAHFRYQLRGLPRVDITGTHHSAIAANGKTIAKIEALALGTAAATMVTKPRVHIFEAIRMTSPKNLRAVKVAPDHDKAIRLGFRPCDIMNTWFGPAHLEVLERQTNREEILLKIDDLNSEITRLGRQEQCEHEKWIEAFKIKQAANPKDKRTAEFTSTVSGELKEQQEALEKAQIQLEKLDIAHPILSYEDIKGLTEDQVKLMTTFRLSRSMVKGVNVFDEVIQHLNLFRKKLEEESVTKAAEIKDLKGSEENAETLKTIDSKIAEEFQRIKHCSYFQLKGLQVGFTLEDLRSDWFGSAHYFAAANANCKIEDLRGLHENQIELLKAGVDRRTIFSYKGSITPKLLDALNKGYPFENLAGLNDFEIDMVRHGVDLQDIRKAKLEKAFLGTALHLKALKLGYDFDEIADFTEVKVALLLTREDLKDPKNQFEIKTLTEAQRTLIGHFLERKYPGLKIQTILSIAKDLDWYTVEQWLQGGNSLEDVLKWNYNCFSLHNTYRLSVSDINGFLARCSLSNEKYMKPWVLENTLRKGFKYDDVKDLEEHQLAGLSGMGRQRDLTLEQVKSKEFTKEVWDCLEDLRDKDMQCLLEHDKNLVALVHRLSPFQRHLLKASGPVISIPVEKILSFAFTPMHIAAIVGGLPFERIEKLSTSEIWKLMEVPGDQTLKSDKEVSGAAVAVSTTTATTNASSAPIIAFSSGAASITGNASHPGNLASNSTWTVVLKPNSTHLNDAKP